MKKVVGLFGAIALSAAAVAGVAAQTPSPFPTAGHGAVGSWFGKAIQICPSRVAPAACSFVGPALALFMTPTLAADGTFLGNDSFAVGSPPFGPHTTAHGQWIALDASNFEADYVFMLNTFPPDKATPVSAVRFRWLGFVVDKTTMEGWVNMYFQPAMAPSWTDLVGNEFPVIPPEATGLVTAPTGFIKDPSLCRTAGCPLVFKFTIKRVAP